ncbi:hypothetical protein GHT06_011760 [Daphnia sinensis]|uniref:Uncharacterized protein n=1 Tax=Daphnia sinensis TaxID=1820382 RepID=A0AAD5LN10_9CRUS|nr:hypothetical protein GHT06_011760 [Daphnia sinensis]
MVVFTEDNEADPRKDEQTKPSNVNNRHRFRITVEPLGFIYLTANIIQVIVTPNLYLQKVCEVNFKINASLCDPRSRMSRNNTELADRVQSYVSTLNIYGSLIDNIPSIFLMLFLLPWSDNHGRKPLMVAPVVGHILCTLLDITNFYCESLPAEYLLISTVPVGLTGGRGIFFMAMYRYVVDITTAEARTWRFSILGGIVAISIPIGNLISGYIYASGGNIAIWGTALVLYSLALLYILFGFTDSLGQKSFSKPSDETVLEKALYGKPIKTKRIELAKEGCMDVFQNLFRCFAETFKRREGYKRACISILIALMCLLLFSQGNQSVGYFYTRKKFGWDAPDWAFFVTLVSASSSIGTLIILPVLSGYFKVRDGIMGILSLVANIGASLTIAFAVSPLMVYLSSIGSTFGPIANIVIRSIFSKTLTSDELSYAYSVLASLESLVPLITAPTMNLIYQATLSFFPGCVYLVRACTMFIVLMLFGILLLLKWKDSHFNQVQPFVECSETPTQLKRSVTAEH